MKIRVETYSLDDVTADKDVAWIAEVFPDWTTLQIIETGQAFAFNRATGEVYLIPHPDVPFVSLKPLADRVAGNGGGDE